MSTVATRALSGKDVSDIVPIKVDGHTYEDKYGLLEVSITNYAWGPTAGAAVAGNVDIRSPNFNQDNDNAIVDNVALTNTQGSTNLTSKYYVAVNNGQPGPSASVQPDGTWDLMNIKYTQPANNALPPVTVTVTYTVTFTDMTPP